ncbi:TonB-dependent receptor plug domain-containing protein [Phaeocystidibacter marisrubri]|uniref:TonB-dependent receptor n=1 Tax=Phaeocystidibacter marisrubri TaxID=1577780 RepID=A0A6L3ZJJ3_9FLAO|nr:TonB-dependent receptor [Phaeocystidibacter marisrubri]KAB2818162.1 TonB-dependent receptor [Phaeocystidibacter marisrubri]GGH71633.1 hypothetical protein GCM10011318_14790 [Phaeocystidibacter marisrubri]
MIKYIYTLLFMGVSAIGLSQTLTVLDAENGEPLELVTIFSEVPRAYAVTNADGQADISEMKGFEKIEIQTFGYAPVITTYQKLQVEGFKVSLELSQMGLQEVVTSASRWRQTSDNVPSKITTISQREVAFQNPQTAADMLSISGQVFVQKSQQGGGSPMIRGFATNRLLYTVDGVRMNTAIFRGGNLQNVISLDPFATENTEVLFGPGSVIYGSDAIGGVMSFQTLTPQLSLDGEPLITGSATARYSSANSEKTGHFHINVGWKKWAMVTSFSTWDFDHLRQGSNGPDDYLKPYHVNRIDSTDVIVTQDDPLLQVPTAYSQTNFMQKVRFKPNENWNFEYGFHYSETSSYGRYDRHNRMRNGTARYAEWKYGPQVWMMNNLSATHYGRNSIYDEMTIRVAQQHFEESRIDRSLNKSDRTTNAEEVEAYSVNIDFNREVTPGHTLFYGVEYVTNLVQSSGRITDITTGAESVGPARYPQSNWTSIAIYLNDEYHVNEHTTIQAGLRYNQYMLNADFDTTFYPFPFTTTKLNNGALTGSIGAVYRPSQTWVISANLGTAFRSPNIDDIGKVFDSEPGSVVVPNPNLEAEYAYNFDVNIAKTFGKTVRVDLGGYYTFLENALVRRDYQLNGLDSMMYDGMLSRVQAIQNAAEARVYGVQAGIEIKLPAGFGFSTRVNYQKGQEEMDNGELSPSRHAAPFFGTSRLTYTANRLQLQLYTQYQGEQSYDNLSDSEKGKDEIYAKDDNGNNYAPSWYTLNIKAAYNVTENMTVSAGIENLTDQRYRPYSSGISGAGRNFVMSVRANF